MFFLSLKKSADCITSSRPAKLSPSGAGGAGGGPGRGCAVGVVPAVTSPPCCAAWPRRAGGSRAVCVCVHACVRGRANVGEGPAACSGAVGGRGGGGGGVAPLAAPRHFGRREVALLHAAPRVSAPSEGLLVGIFSPSRFLPSPSAQGLSPPDGVRAAPASRGRRARPLVRGARILLLVCPSFMPRSRVKQKRASGADLLLGPVVLSSWSLSCLVTSARC